ncbi:MAG: NAD(P)/FAD-dependent oxidoreductase [Blautia sp.]
MITIQQLKLPVSHTPEELEQKILKTLKIKKESLLSFRIRKQSLDSRKKPDLYFVYTIDAAVEKESAVFKKVNHNNIMLTSRKKYKYLKCSGNFSGPRPVIAGSGPAGLFCAYYLARSGLSPLVIERGDDVDTRMKKVATFWEENVLDTQSNVQFGEGGAGTFSDGKLNTLVKDSAGRNQEVLRLFVECGAPEEILYVQKPHLGTDLLVSIVKNLRNKILEMGGEIRFRAQLTDIHTENGRLKSITINHGEEIPTDHLVLAIGHSARDTFSTLEKNGFHMEAKSFAVGLRIEHPQTLINRYQYGIEQHPVLGAASYKLTHRAGENRGVYSFCMCPGGYVVNASSEQGRLAVNGMSYQDRASANANSAMIVTVNPSDFPFEGPLAGMAFQRTLEEKAFQAGHGNIPVQLFGDFCENRNSTGFGTVTPCIKGAFTFADLNQVLPSFLTQPLKEGIRYFERIIPGFSREDAILSGVESRTSSPVRIIRDENFESNIAGVYPCGEGAGYAGGITSAAMDGLKIGEAIVKKIINF